MRKRLTALMVFISWIAYGQSDHEGLVGQWEGVDAGDSLMFVFEKDSIMTVFNGRDKQMIFGGRESVRLGKKVVMIYLTDLSRKPFAIDFVILEIETRIEQGRMKGIFEFVGENKIRISIWPDKERPTTFEGPFVVLTKMPPTPNKN
jgi:hypothetical protein